ncbi:DUF3263 domain-containing protein [Williamsia serinedens]|uniref:DUF3263 domain-containing protein n=1 Tax=Williamsia serinedens TaxID=391736 RepID=A0ABT1H628_9NOCA|nr:DUF3263 domain-containing protein [Williamsia serinedens]MCP2162695.1 Protein of unknown function (DUF3263) [Williamsia serinedens]
MTDDDKQLLEFAGRWWRNAGAAESAVQRELGLSPVRYYQRLNRLLDEGAAVEFDPILTNRLLRIRSERESRRRGAH